MYSQYDKYIKDTYQNTLSQIVAMIQQQYPRISDPDWLIREGMAESDEYWTLVSDMHSLVKSFDLAYIYFLQKDAGAMRFLLSDDDTPAALKKRSNFFVPYADTEEIRAVYATKTLQLSSKPLVDEYGTFVSALLPVIKNGEVAGIIGADYDISFVRAVEGRAIIALVIALVLAISFSIALALTASSSLIKPINCIIDVLNTIVTGDLTSHVADDRADELGQMMRLLNQMQESIKSLVMAIGDKAQSLSAIGIELSSMMTESAAAINQISATTQSMKTKAISQAASVTETNATVGQIIANIGALSTNIEEQFDSVSRSSAAIEEMTANIALVTESLIENQQNVQTLSETAEKGHIALQQVSTDIQEITRESEQLLEINKVIQHIASQTNLLSMNAAIEAAHAGEVGKGFAVVADEIRKLAESSNEQAKTVSVVLKKIKASLDGISGSTKTALIHFEAIDSSVQTVSDHEGRIRSTMEEQDSGSREILATMNKSTAITQDVRQGSEAMLNSSHEVIGEGKNLEVLTADLDNGMNEVAVGMNQINGAVMRIQEMGYENKQSINVLLQEIAKFKIA
jgi:methyl-accepting chemotaxis protein